MSWRKDAPVNAKTQRREVRREEMSVFDQLRSSETTDERRLEGLPWKRMGFFKGHAKARGRKGREE